MPYIVECETGTSVTVQLHIGYLKNDLGVDVLEDTESVTVENGHVFEDDQLAHRVKKDVDAGNNQFIKKLDGRRKRPTASDDGYVQATAPSEHPVFDQVDETEAKRTGK